MEKFDYLHNVVKLTHGDMVKFPEIFDATLKRIKERSQYLKALKRDQYNPDEPNYVPPLALAEGSDADFCERYAKTSVDDFNYFLKTM